MIPHQILPVASNITHTMLAITDAPNIGMIAIIVVRKAKNTKYGIPTNVNDSAVTTHCKIAMIKVDLTIDPLMCPSLCRYRLVILGSRGMIDLM
jgi:hypothetical protein